MLNINNVNHLHSHFCNTVNLKKKKKANQKNRILYYFLIHLCKKNPPNSLECHHPKKCITGRTLNATLHLQHSRARDNMTTSTGISLIEYIITHRGAHVQQIRMQHLHVCIHHKLFIQHKRNLRIMTVYIIFTINILHFCLGVRESSTSVAFRTFWLISRWQHGRRDVKGTFRI